jgi:hypothetical protein
MIKFPKPKYAFDYKDYRLMPKEDAISMLLNDGEIEVKWLTGWFEVAAKNPDQYHFVKFEDLKIDTFHEFQKMLDFYGIYLKKEMMDSIIEEAHGRSGMVKNLTASTILPFGISSNFRAGKVGGWQGEFTEKNITESKKTFGEALIKFGYETSLDW